MPAAKITQAPAKRVLIIDDQSDVADSLAMLVRALGYETRVAYDGPSGMKIAQSFHPDVFLLDIGLPGDSGLEVARKLRKTSVGKNAKLVAISGWGTEFDRNAGLNAGFDHYLTKPVRVEVIEELLATL